MPAFVDQLREHDVTPHVAQKIRYSALDGRTTRHRTCALAAYNLVRIRNLTASTV